MRPVDRYVAAVLAAADGRPAERDALAAELRAHLLDLTAEYQRSGLPPEEATRRALLRMGPPEVLAGALRAVRGPWPLPVPARAPRGRARPPGARTLAAGLGLLLWFAGMAGSYLWPA
ncbi:MAG TPA: permease prefix domain 1-containing protein [Dehalococcoidia bacterium]